jgi:hypothetical protein
MMNPKIKFILLVISIASILLVFGCGGGNSTGPKESNTLTRYDLPPNTPEPPIPMNVIDPIPLQSDTIAVGRSENRLLDVNFTVDVLQDGGTLDRDINAQGTFRLLQTRYWEKASETFFIHPDSTIIDTVEYMVGITLMEKQNTSETLGISSQIAGFSDTIISVFGDSAEVRAIYNDEAFDAIVSQSGKSNVTVLFTVWQLVNRFHFADDNGNILDETELSDYARVWLRTIRNEMYDDEIVIEVDDGPMSFEVREDVLHYQVLEF